MNDDFYIRLYYILEKKGKLNYIALHSLLEKCLKNKLENDNQ